MTEAPVEIVFYDPSWPPRFVEEQGVLQRALAAWLARPIEHIGSTAIPGLSAKPVIDIMAAVQTLDGSRLAISAATRLGYCYSPYKSDLEHWFCKPSPAFRTHHLHLVPLGSPQWLGPIAFRNYLRKHIGVAAEYEALKRDWLKNTNSTGKLTQRRSIRSSTESPALPWTMAMVQGILANERGLPNQALEPSRLTVPF